MPIRYTSRGFPVFTEFHSKYNGDVCIVESSFATEHCVWIQFDEHANEPIRREALHVNKEEARKIVEALQEFIKSE
ncbi:hypothetical protein GRF59_14740 [Paenibacillus sp. HJL G12]|uniref:Uncharacterized protein n=1 Tax=Paenibacillus dendrobii TaxID=2691084 RepID=A0A7X3IK22_9BACL|nr:hypothetical protein [Paenibacillus dendrobii]